MKKLIILLLLIAILVFFSGCPGAGSGPDENLEGYTELNDEDLGDDTETDPPAEDPPVVEEDPIGAVIVCVVTNRFIDPFVFGMLTPTTNGKNITDFSS
jgi:hypothetical protein